MINLLPDERKVEIRAARTNVILLRYNLITLVAIAILAVTCLGFYAFLRSNEQDAMKASQTNSQQTASLQKVRDAADAYRSNLTSANQIIDNGVAYSDVIVAITKLLPAGAILDNLKLSASTFGQQTIFEAHAANYNIAEQMKQSFQNSDMFTDVHFQSLVTSSSGSTLSKKYPVTINMSATLKKTVANNEKK